MNCTNERALLVKSKLYTGYAITCSLNFSFRFNICLVQQIFNLSVMFTQSFLNNPHHDVIGCHNNIYWLSWRFDCHPGSFSSVWQEHPETVNWKRRQILYSVSLLDILVTVIVSVMINKILFIIFNIALYVNFIKAGFTFKHHNNEELYDILDNIHSRCPNITHLYSLVRTSVHGLPLAVIEFSDQPGRHEIRKSLHYSILYDSFERCYCWNKLGIHTKPL